MPDRHLTEAQAEKIADRMVWRLLATDTAYLHAEDAEAQAAREDAIAAAVWRDLEARYVIA